MIESRLELFTVYDRNPDDNNAIVVAVYGTADEAIAKWPPTFPVTRNERGGFDTKRKIYNYNERERIR
jgi:hypothetical protein